MVGSELLLVTLALVILSYLFPAFSSIERIVL